MEWETMKTDGSCGYILEVDLEYPEELHEKHSDFPLAPENCNITEDDLSEQTLNGLSKIHVSSDGTIRHRTRKLIGTFRERKNYIVHFHSLQTYLRLGMKLKKVHKVLKFNQSDFMCSYITFISQLRSATTSKWMNTVLKLLANAIYGKMCENARNYTSVRFCQTETNLRKSISSPFFKSFHIYSESLVAVFMKPPKVVMKHCLPVGFSILEHSKRIMQELYYDNILPLSGLIPSRDIRICTTDTDSFIFAVECESLDKFFGDISPCLDFSNFPRDHPLYSDSRKGEVGLLKDEMKGSDNIAAVCSLRSKCYSLKLKQETNGVKVKNTCKGCPKAITKLITFEQYKTSLLSNQPHRETFRKITAARHAVYTKEQTNRLVFSAIDDKRYYTCPIHSIPYGDFRIKQFKENGGCPICK
jgi:hypothetical protein